MSRVIAPASKSLFRRLWRAGDSSVLYSRPAVYYVRQRIREGFEEYKNVTNENILNDLFERCENTIKFLEISAKRKGFEHKVIYSLCEMTYIQNRYKRRPPHSNKRLSLEMYNMHAHSYDDYYLTVKMMNDNLKLCLR
ncbi:2995_t:CDS:2 [Funneliformis mosseae]|uniref:2995_t:CDS:1 n=2 Tax=Funneliformis TaxID=1117308 RepID=A0A9N8VAG8_FUNMO|nr:2995_t:CDS:2 [Funneliformis mosseae]